MQATVELWSALRGPAWVGRPLPSDVFERLQQAVAAAKPQLKKTLQELARARGDPDDLLGKLLVEGRGSGQAYALYLLAAEVRALTFKYSPPDGRGLPIEYLPTDDWAPP